MNLKFTGQGTPASGLRYSNWYRCLMEDIASGEAQSRPQEVYLADSVGEPPSALDFERSQYWPY